MDKGRQADGRGHAAFLSPLSGQRGATVVSVIAYNLGNLSRRLALPTGVATGRQRPVAEADPDAGSRWAG